jgi:hypothetical protein
LPLTQHQSRLRHNAEMLINQKHITAKKKFHPVNASLDQVNLNSTQVMVGGMPLLNNDSSMLERKEIRVRITGKITDLNTSSATPLSTKFPVKTPLNLRRNIKSIHSPRMNTRSNFSPSQLKTPSILNINSRGVSSIKNNAKT